MSASRTLLLLAVVMSLGLTGCLDTVSDAFGDEVDQGEQAPFAPGWPALEEAEIRPGVRVVESPEFSGVCTANFVFSSPDNRTLYLGTASHCVTGRSIGDDISIDAGTATGTLVYCSWGTMDQGQQCTDRASDEEGYPNDFALIQLPEEARSLVHPALIHWGGPTQSYQGTAEGDHVLTYGNTALRDGDQEDLGPVDPREGYVRSSGPWTTYVTMVPPSISGDSGSPAILADGSALGVIQTVGVGPDGVINGVVNLGPAMAFVHETTDLRIELATWPMQAQPQLPNQAPLPTNTSPGDVIPAAP